MRTLDRCEWCHSRDCPGCYTRDDFEEEPQLDGDYEPPGDWDKPTNQDASQDLDAAQAARGGKHENERKRTA